jgi:hypothetical protein
MTRWTVKGDMVELSATLAGDFLGLPDWRRTFPVAIVADFGLEAWAEFIAAYHHVAASGEGRLAVHWTRLTCGPILT